MKILFVVDGLRSGGKERRLVELLKGLTSQHKFFITLVVLSDKIHFEEVHELDIELSIIRRSRSIDSKVFRNLFKILRDLNPTSVISWDSMSTIYLGVIARVLGVSLIHSISDAPANIRWLSKKWIRAKTCILIANKVISNSHAGLAAYKVPMSKSVCIYNGIDPKRLLVRTSPDVIRQKLNICTKHVVGMVAAFRSHKDYKTFLMSAQEILKIRKDVTFVCIGTGLTLKECKSYVDQQFKEKIIFTGEVSDVDSIVNVLNIGILCTYTEGISNSIMEYMLFSKPVIATNGGGTGELVKKNETGLLVKPKQEEELKAGILQLLNNPNYGKQLGMEGKRRILKYFTIERMTKEYTHYFLNL